MAFTEGLCQNLQVNLNTVTGNNAPQLKRDRVGYLDAIVSQENTAGVEMLPIPTNGKYRKVQVNYAQRGIEDSVSLTCTNNCTATNEVEPKEAIVDVDKCVESALLFNEDEMRKLCEADSLWVSQTIMGQMNAINVAQQILLVGKENQVTFQDYNSDPESCLDITFWNTIVNASSSYQFGYYTCDGYFYGLVTEFSIEVDQVIEDNSTGNIFFDGTISWLDLNMLCGVAVNLNGL